MMIPLTLQLYVEKKWMKNDAMVEACGSGDHSYLHISEFKVHDAHCHFIATSILEFLQLTN